MNVENLPVAENCSSMQARNKPSNNPSWQKASSLVYSTVRLRVALRSILKQAQKKAWSSKHWQEASRQSIMLGVKNTVAALDRQEAIAG